MDECKNKSVQTKSDVIDRHTQTDLQYDKLSETDCIRRMNGDQRYRTHLEGVLIRDNTSYEQFCAIHRTSPDFDTAETIIAKQRKESMAVLKKFLAT